jgi:hypothetical protein
MEIGTMLYTPKNNKLFSYSSILNAFEENVKILGDSGYQGIKNYHENSEHPIKKP